MAVWYCGSTKHAAVAQWAANTVYGAGAIVRQLAAPAKGDERCFRTAAGGTSHGTTEPTWVLTKAAAQPADGTISDWTEVTGNSTYGWTAPHASIAKAVTWMAAGDTLYVNSAHDYQWADSATIQIPGSAAALSRILSVNDGLELTPGASETCAGAANIALNVQGYGYLYGVTLQGGSNLSTVSLHDYRNEFYLVLEQCTITVKSNGSLVIGEPYNGESGLVELIDCTVSFNHAGGYVALYGQELRMRGCSVTGTAPTILFQAASYGGPNLVVSGTDLSVLGSGKSLVKGDSNYHISAHFENCKLGSDVSLTSAAAYAQGGVTVTMVNCDSADTNYNYQKTCYQGTITDATATYRDATDGTTAFSRKMVTTAGANFISPLVSDPIAVWNETTGSAVTVTVEVVTDNVTLTDAEAWIEVEYLGTSGVPLSLFTSDRAANILATPANQTASSVTWTGAPGTPVKQKLSVSVTPQEKGPILVRVMLAKASTTMYFCPKVDIT